MFLSDLATKACRDPTSYTEEIRKQLFILQSQLELIQSNSSIADENEFIDLLNFTARLAGIQHYAPLYAIVVPSLVTFTESSALLLTPAVRLTLVQTLILFVKRGILSLSDPNLLSLYCGLLRTHDKEVRKLVYNHLLNMSLKLSRAGKTSNMHRMLSFFSMKMREGNALLVFKLTQLCCELYSKHVWENEQTMSVILECLLKTNDKRVSLLVLNFLLLEKISAEKDSDDEEDDQGVSRDEKKAALKAKISHLQAVSGFAGNQTKVHKNLARAQKNLRALMDDKPEDKEHVYASSIHPYDNIRDPYVLVEKICSKYIGRNTSFPLKLLAFEVTSKIIAHHSLDVHGYYRYYFKYLRPQQKDVTKILEYLVTSVHPAIFDEEIFSIIKVIATEFIHSGSTDYIMTVGLNAISELAKRNPNALIATPGACELLNELASYSKEAVIARSYQNSKCKTTSKSRRGVMSAARNLLQFYREYAPDKLDAKFQNRDSAQVVRQLKALERLKHNEDSEDEDSESIESMEESSYSSVSDTAACSLPVSSKKIDASDFSKRNIAKLLREAYSDDEELAPSKHQIKKRKLEKSKYSHILANCRAREIPIPECYFAKVNELFGPIDEYGNPCEQDSADSASTMSSASDDIPPGKCVQVVNGSRGKARKVFIDAPSESDSDNSHIPLQSRRLLTDEELARISDYVKPSHMNEVDLESFLPKKKLTRAEKTVLAHSGRSPTDHKGSRWADSIARKLNANKSLSNVQKQKTTKNILMILHSQKLRNKRARSGIEKDRIARTHVRNQKLGISKKATAKRNK